MTTAPARDRSHRLRGIDELVSFFNTLERF
jgi:hypothetical protein